MLQSHVDSSSKRRRLALGCPILSFLLLQGALPAGAKESPPNPSMDTEEQRRKAQEEAARRKEVQEAPHVRLQAPGPGEDEEEPSLPSESPSFRIDQIVLEVAAAPSPHAPAGTAQYHPPLPHAFRFVEKYLQLYKGREMGAEGVGLILRRLNRLIIAKGYATTRVGLPEQDLSTGTLRVLLVPGIIRNVLLSDPAWKANWRMAFPIRPRKVLNIRDLEQGMEQVKRLPSEDIVMDLLPGAQPGESDVLLKVRSARAWRAAATVDDSGLPSLGKWQGDLVFSWDNPSGLLDAIQFRLGRNLASASPGARTRSGAVQYSLPAGYWTLTVASSWHDETRRLTDTIEPIEVTTRSRALEAKASLLFYRNQTRKEGFQIRLGKHWSDSILNQTEVDVQRRRGTTVELAFTHLQYFRWGQWDLTAALRRGVPWFGARADLAGGRGSAPTFFYRLGVLDTSLCAPFSLAGLQLRHSITFRGQWSPDQLYPADGFSIGNRWTVRGFEGDSALSATRGFFLRNDLECLPGPKRPTFYVGLDTGRVRESEPASKPAQGLTGMVVGVRWVFAKHFHFECFVGGPLRKPPELSERWPVMGLSLVVLR